MRDTDDQNYQPRRFKAEVRRSKSVKKRDTKQHGSPAEEAPAPILEEAEVQAPVPESPEPPSERHHTVVLPDSDEPDLAIEGLQEIDNEEYVDRTKVLPNEEFEYVVPNETFRQHIRRRHRSEHKGNTKIASKEEMKDAEAGYIFMTRRKHRKRKRKHRHHHHKFRHLALWKRILIITGIVLLALIVALTGTFFTLREIGRHSMLHYGNAQVDIPETDDSGNPVVTDERGHVITYKGVSYELNPHLMSVVFIGHDEGTDEDASLQMSDAIYILTVDSETGKSKILGISRDTITDVDIYSDEGAYIKKEPKQLAYAYAYGNDEVTGGRNTCEALERLFYGLPFENYFAINMDALITLNDTIGGVTLVSSMTFTSPIDGRTINEGDTVTLHGKEAERYVRSRDHVSPKANSERMKRQQEYIRAFLSAIIPTAKKDISMISELYKAIKVNSDTTLNVSKMTYIASTALTKMNGASDVEYITLDGTVTVGEDGYARMDVTNDQTIETMLKVFYTPITG